MTSRDFVVGISLSEFRCRDFVVGIGTSIGPSSSASIILSTIQVFFEAVGSNLESFFRN